MTDDMEKIAVHGEKINQLEVRMDKLDEILDKVRNRLPVYATLLIAILLGIIGWLARGVTH